MQPVDAFIQHARQLLGVATVAGTPRATAEDELADRHPSGWGGDASAGAGAAARRLDGFRTQLRSSQAGVHTAVESANQISQRARIRLDVVEAEWQQDKAVLGQLADTSEGKAALLAAGQQRIAETTDIVEESASEFQRVSAQVRGAVVGLPREVMPASSGGPDEHDHEHEPPHYVTDIPGMVDGGEGHVFWIPGNGMVF